MKCLIILSLILLPPGLAFPSTIYVPDHFPTIQSAVDNATAGDTVIVRPGTYVENIDFLGKGITLTSEKGPEVTAIDGGNPVNPDYGSVVSFQNGEGLDSVLKGFTVTNGQGRYDPSWGTLGGGIYCFKSSPTVTNNIISSNTGDWGGGMYCEESAAPSFVNNAIVTNKAVWGGGIYCYMSSPTIAGCVILDNEADAGGGIYPEVSSHPDIINNLICGNRVALSGGGIFPDNDSNPVISNNTLMGNSAVLYGGGICCALNSSPIITNGIIWGNHAQNGPEIYEGICNPIVTFSDIKGGWPGTGNIDADPLFAEGPSGFHYLGQFAAGQPSDSPCVDQGSDLASNLGMDIYWTRTDGVTDSGVVDMGFHYGSFLFPALQTDTFMIPESTGGTANLLLLAGSACAGRNYIILGSASGTEPGIPLPGGKATLPLNWDVFTNVVVGLVNTPVFSNFLGSLDGSGSAKASFDTLGPIPGAAGLTLHFAYALNNPWDIVSNPIGITILP